MPKKPKDNLDKVVEKGNLRDQFRNNMSTSKTSKNETSNEKKQVKDELTTFGLQFPNKSQEEGWTEEHKE